MNSLLPLELPILHAIPGRLRIAVPALSPLSARCVERQVRGLPGVRDARHNPLTHNLLVHYDADVTHQHALLAGVGALLAAGRDSHSAPPFLTLVPRAAPPGAPAAWVPGTAARPRVMPSTAAARPRPLSSPAGSLAWLRVARAALDVIGAVAGLLHAATPLGLLLAAIEAARVLVSLVETHHALATHSI